MEKEIFNIYEVYIGIKQINNKYYLIIETACNDVYQEEISQKLFKCLWEEF